MNRANLSCKQASFEHGWRWWRDPAAEIAPMPLKDAPLDHARAHPARHRTDGR